MNGGVDVNRKTLILVGILFLLITNFCLCTDSGEENEDLPLGITMKSPTEKTYGWQIEIHNIKDTPNLIDVKFQMFDNENTLLYSLIIDESNPAAFKKGNSTVYAMTKVGPVIDDETNTTVDGNDRLSDYSNCYIAYVDQSSDGKCNGGDSTSIFKDYNNDGIDEITKSSTYTFRIVENNKIILEKNF